MGCGRLPPVESWLEAELVVAMAPASSQSSKCCCSEGSDPFCGLDRPSHTSPLLLFLSLQRRPFPMAPPHPHTQYWSPDYTLDRAPSNWPAKSLDRGSGHSRLCVGSSLPLRAATAPVLCPEKCWSDTRSALSTFSNRKKGAGRSQLYLKSARQLWTGPTPAS